MNSATVEKLSRIICITEGVELWESRKRVAEAILAAGYTEPVEADPYLDGILARTNGMRRDVPLLLTRDRDQTAWLNGYDQTHNELLQRKATR